MKKLFFNSSSTLPLDNKVSGLHIVLSKILSYQKSIHATRYFNMESQETSSTDTESTQDRFESTYNQYITAGSVPFIFFQHNIDVFDKLKTKSERVDEIEANRENFDLEDEGLYESVFDEGEYPQTGSLVVNLGLFGTALSTALICGLLFSIGLRGDLAQILFASIVSFLTITITYFLFICNEIVFGVTSKYSKLSRYLIIGLGIASTSVSLFYAFAFDEIFPSTTKSQSLSANLVIGLFWSCSLLASAFLLSKTLSRSHRMELQLL